MTPNLIRAFFAINLPLECKILVGDCIENLKKHLQHPHIRWVKLENIHLTLQFLAQVNVDDIISLIQHVQSELQHLHSFHLHLGNIEWFPSQHRPRVISLQVAPNDILAKLSAAIGKGITAIDYPIEHRAFRGHLTLARVEELEQVDEEILSNIHLPTFPEILVKEIVLYQSEPQASGSKYTALAKLGLR